jgi:uncharacterized Fe-S cluster protein YjdI
MAASLQTPLAFHLTGRRPPASELLAVSRAELLPAPLASYRDLPGLRYDFPLVLTDDNDTWVEPLSGVCDRILHNIAGSSDGDRLSRHVLRLERELRRTVARGAKGALGPVWTAAVARLAAAGDALVADSLQRATAALHLHGELVDCDVDLPSQLLTHAWRRVQARKAAAFQADIDRLTRGLTDILRADAACSAEGCRADRLRAAVGGADADAFDFDALSRILTTAAPASTLSASRRGRIERVIGALRQQEFYPPTSFTFSRPSAALAAYRERLPTVAALARALTIAELEVDHSYREDRHDPLFEAAGPNALGPADLAVFPDSLVVVNAYDLTPAEQTALLEILAAGLPIKILVQWDELLEESASGDGHLTLDARSRQLATMAMSGGDAYVVHAPASVLFQMRERLIAGMAYQGPGLFCVYSGAGRWTSGLPPYLAAAAALESRAFPAFVYDPAAGSDWASRFSLQGNPQLEEDWPAEPLPYEDARHQRQCETLPFTFAEFVACDERGARHFARVPDSDRHAAFARVSDAVLAGPAAIQPAVPALWMVDRALALQKVIVDERLLHEVRRCRDQWRSLQELGGVHNSHAERLIARERQRAAVTEPPRHAAGQAPATVPAAEPATSEAPAERAPGDPYIETARCSTCNECTRINPRMFAYNENQQAYIKDPDAGTFAELVEAAESCQVAIIHPGTPRSPGEPGLEDLIARAAPFQ